MTQEEHRLYRLKLTRVARVKRLLRWMPRKATMHKYPVLRWFAVAARKRSYLWSFRMKEVIPAFYTGCILSLLPIYGLQLPIAVGLSFILRANLPLLTSLQFITNPITILPAYFTVFQIGRVILNPLGIETPVLNMQEMKLLIDSITAGNWGYNLRYISSVWLVTTLGGCVLGTFLGATLSVIYRLAAYEVTVLNQRLKAIQMKRKEPPSVSSKENPSTEAGE